MKWQENKKLKTLNNKIKLDNSAEMNVKIDLSPRRPWLMSKGTFEQWINYTLKEETFELS